MPMCCTDYADAHGNEDDADEDTDTEERGDISYATRLVGQCLGPHLFLVPHQFIKLDHMLHHFGPHPTNISLLHLFLITQVNNSRCDELC